ncbi:ACT domain-containing protein [Saccharomonospora piscinae]|uniref:ACT domain-containing protein n=1 Tax=Saccharomonospora piscinae TaxID=687388 RepID=UPI00110688AA|nr:ACT domain-containing protein [Saccharomonospora piscinae]TLW95266.1 ACT domain-containing protein [Saccharomonospora piscinae]
MRKLVIDTRPGEYAVVRLGPGASVPPRLFEPGDSLVSVTRTPGELSVVCAADRVPEDAVVETGWRVLTVRGPLDFTLTGIMAALSSELAAAGVSLFALSTYDTDHLLVKDADLERAVAALRGGGHEVHGT